METFGVTDVLDAVLREDDVDRVVGKWEALPDVEVDHLVRAAVVLDVGVEPALVRVAAGAKLESAHRVRPQVRVDLPLPSDAAGLETCVAERLAAGCAHLPGRVHDRHEAWHALQPIPHRQPVR